MKLKVWSDKETWATEEGQLYVKIDACPEHGDIHIFVVDHKGERVDRGNLIHIDQDLKCLIICDHVNEIVPLKTDIDGELIYVTEDEYRERHKHHIHQTFMAHMIQSAKDGEQQSASKH